MTWFVYLHCLRMTFENNKMTERKMFAFSQWAGLCISATWFSNSLFHARKLKNCQNWKQKILIFQANTVPYSCNLLQYEKWLSQETFGLSVFQFGNSSTLWLFICSLTLPMWHSTLFISFIVKPCVILVFSTHEKTILIPLFIVGYMVCIVLCFFQGSKG